jgi:hypothetical protein
MADYNYQDGKFSDKDALPSGDPNKIVKGSDFEVEFLAIESMSQTKMDTTNPTYGGTMTGVNLTLSGTLDVGLIDGGTYSG